MWICLNDSFLSIVDAAERKGCLLVRARVKGHIEAVFPDAKVVSLPDRDYQFRAEIPRTAVSGAIAGLIEDIHYPNFKNSVLSRTLHEAYAKVWSVMASIQLIPPYSGSGSMRPAGNPRVRGRAGWTTFEERHSRS